jgi:hypothetical protein
MRSRTPHVTSAQRMCAHHSTSQNQHKGTYKQGGEGGKANRRREQGNGCCSEQQVLFRLFDLVVFVTHHQTVSDRLRADTQKTSANWQSLAARACFAAITQAVASSFSVSTNAESSSAVIPATSHRVNPPVIGRGHDEVRRTDQRVQVLLGIGLFVGHLDLKKTLDCDGYTVKDPDR